jgi:hypothetical protein
MSSVLFALSKANNYSIDRLQKVNGQEDHLTKASTGSKRRKMVVYRNGSDTREPLER